MTDLLSAVTLEAELKEFLRKPQNDAEPPTLPPHLGNLPHTTYVTAALDYLDDYPFDRPFVMSTGWAVDPNAPNYQGWDEKARSYLKACVEVDRSSLASIDPTYDGDLAQKQFIHEGIFNQRWTLEELASEIIALVELIRSDARSASTVTTPETTGKGIDDRVADKVRLRDENCRLSGVIRERNWTPEEFSSILTSGLPVASMEVAHGLPFEMGKASFDLVEVLTGLPAATWGDTVNCVENALLMQRVVHQSFAKFSIYFELGPNNVIYVRGRTSPPRANPILVLRGVCNVEGRSCDTALNTQLRSPKLQTIPDINIRFSTLHKFIGDIAWMCGGVELQSDDEDSLQVLSAENWLVFKQKLTCPNNFVAQHEV